MENVDEHVEGLLERLIRSELDLGDERQMRSELESGLKLCSTLAADRVRRC